jgi:hypothetical protein
VRVIDLERKGSEGSTPRKRGKSGGAGQIPPADGPRCSGELRGAWPRMAAHSFGGSGMDERGRGETGSGRWPTFILKENNSVVQPREGREGGAVGVGAPAWRREKKERGGTLARRWVTPERLSEVAAHGCGGDGLPNREGGGARATRHECD